MVELCETSIVQRERSVGKLKMPNTGEIHEAGISLRELERGARFQRASGHFSDRSGKRQTKVRRSTLEACATSSSDMIAAMRFLVAMTMMAGMAALFAQSQPAFEVASVKMTPASNAGYSTFSPYGKGRFTVTKVTLELLICLAYGVDDTQIVDAPGWLRSQNYDVDAKGESGVSLSYEEVKPRLRQLLAQRFKLTFHTQTHDVAGYALVVAKGGPKLKPSTSSAQTGGFMLPNRLWNENATMEMLPECWRVRYIVQWSIRRVLRAASTST
jgi:hypothetical protein